MPTLERPPLSPDRLRCLMALLDRRHVEVAREAGISKTYLSLFLHGVKQAPPEVVKRIERAILSPIFRPAEGGE